MSSFFCCCSAKYRALQNEESDEELNCDDVKSKFLSELDDKLNGTDENGQVITFQNKGIAFIVSNDDNGNLHSAKRDAETMKMLFQELKNYIVIVKENLSVKKFNKICTYLAKPESPPHAYPDVYKRLVFYFAGHGGSGYICMKDGRVQIKDILSEFGQSSCLKNMIKLLFIDACRGEIKSKNCRGGKSEISLSYDNMLVAYATLNHQVAYSFDDGIWTKQLYEYLYYSKDHLSNLLRLVNKTLKSIPIETNNEIFYQVSNHMTSLGDDIHFWREAGQMPEKIDDNIAVKNTKIHLQSCYLKRPADPTRWPNLKGPAQYLDVTIVKSKEDLGADENITVDTILTNGKQNIILIEGDPGVGKTTFVINICKQWAKGELLTKDLVFLVSLRDSDYQNVNSLYKLFTKLGCPDIEGYAQHNHGNGLVFILDGWDELPVHLQSKSFFHDMIFEKKALTCSTIIVTSRPSCSNCISEAAKDHYYQILGFTEQTVNAYINEYYKSNALRLQCLRETLIITRQKFYIPIIVTIFCFLYSKNANELPKTANKLPKTANKLPKTANELPKTLSELYGKFVLHCIRANIPDNLKEKFTSLQFIPVELSSVFTKLCRKALHMLTVTDETKIKLEDKELAKELEDLKFKSNDAFGLLSIEYVSNDLDDQEIRYSFLHHSVKQFLAAMSILSPENTVINHIDDYFDQASWTNVFQFMFGLINKPLLKSLCLAKKLQEVFAKDNKLLTIILHCLFEAQDKTLCHEFGQVLDEKKDVNLTLKSDVEYEYTAYFLSVCGCKGLNVTGLSLTDNRIEIMANYLSSRSDGIASFGCNLHLSKSGFKNLGKILANLSETITELLVSYNLTVDNLDFIGYLTESRRLRRLSIECCAYDKEYSTTFVDALCNTTSLEELSIDLHHLDNGKTISKILRCNNSIKTFLVRADFILQLPNIFNGLSSNGSVKTFIASFICGVSNKLMNSIKTCLKTNRSLTYIDFTTEKPEHTRDAKWGQYAVQCFCLGLMDNNTLETLNISGCYLDEVASNNVCTMLTQNASLKHLILNPFHMEQGAAADIIENYNQNATLEVLSLVQWTWQNNPFTFSQEINTTKQVIWTYEEYLILREKLPKTIGYYWKKGYKYEMTVHIV